MSKVSQDSRLTFFISYVKVLYLFDILQFGKYNNVKFNLTNSTGIVPLSVSILFRNLANNL